MHIFLSGKHIAEFNLPNTLTTVLISSKLDLFLIASSLLFSLVIKKFDPSRLIN